MSDREKWAWLERAPALDAGNAETRALARTLELAARETANPRRAFVMLAHCIARDCIAYQTDTARVGGEDIAGFTRKYAHPLEALRRGRDDCDAKARLFCALCIAGGISARMVPLWNGEALQHVSAAVELERGKWTPIETILARARIGDTARDVPAERTTGRWLYT